MPSVRVLTDHKSLIYFKTQSKLSCTQAKWMNTLEELNLDIEYKPGSKMLQADALSRLSMPKDGHPDEVDPDWPLIYNFDYNNNILPEGTSHATLIKVVHNEKKFKLKQKVVQRLLPSGKLVPYITTSQRADTVLKYHKDLRHTRGLNMYKILRDLMWWLDMEVGIKKILKTVKSATSLIINLT